MPLRCTRPITPEERRLLQRERVLGLLIGWPVILSFPFVFIVALAFLALADPSSNGSVPSAFLVLMVAVLVLLGWLAMMGMDARRRAKRDNVDLKVGLVKEFALPVLPESRDQIADPAEVTRFEILAGSGRLWSENGQRVRGQGLRTVTVVAETPEFAAIAAQWLEPAGSIAGSPVDVGSRELSEAERAELRATARATWRGPLLWIVPLTLWYWTIQILVTLSGHGLPGFWNRLEFTCLAFITWSADGAYVYAVRRAIELNRDAKAGRVMIGRIRGMPQDGGGESDFNFELLPSTRIYWTENGAPASWRTRTPE